MVMDVEFKVSHVNWDVSEWITNLSDFVKGKVGSEKDFGKRVSLPFHSLTTSS